MKTKFVCIALATLLFQVSAAAAGKAQFHLHGLSLRFQPGTTTSQGLKYTLALTTDSPASSVLNGELAPLPAGASGTHGSYYQLSGDLFFEPVNGLFNLNLPAPKDDNRNGVADFFESSQAVASTTTEGTFEDFEQRGKVTTIWSRGANSKNGTCRLSMDAYGLTFNLTYEVLEFIGTLTYTTLETNVTGTVALTNNASPPKTLSGKIDFNKVSTELLAMASGAWTNETGQSLPYFASEEFDRIGTNYVDFFLFGDGDLSTSVEDYVLWLARINDANDANANGIPDLSDVALPRAPVLSLTQSNKQLLLSISGLLGKRHDVERVAALGQTNWTVVTSLTLTNDPQTVVLPPPTNGNSFWRVRLP
jgi:hypothetical protein